MLLSFPKSGRTWIRAFLVIYEDLSGIPTEIIYKHQVFHKNPKRKRLLLVRDPCDILVSLFWENKYRSNLRSKKRYLRDFGFFIRSPQGAEHISRCWNSWLNDGAKQLEIKYEDLQNCIWEKILRWFRIEVKKDIVLEANELCKFDNLRKNLHRFKGHEWETKFLAKENQAYTTHPKNPETHKFRRGKIGGYVDYLSPDDINYIRKHVPEAARWYREYT